MSNVVIEAKNLSKKYKKKYALTDCNISIPQGRVVGLVGPNGAGKSTLMQIALGLIPTYMGEINVLGSIPAQDASQLAKIGFVGQDAPLYSQFDVRDSLNFGKWLNPSWDESLISDRVERLGITLRQKVGSLSGGERAQLALALAVAKNPELLILDEPTASLDPLARMSFLQFLMEDVASHSRTVLISSHLVSDLERVCDYIIILVASKVQLALPVGEVLATHKRLICKKRPASSLPTGVEVIEEKHSTSQSIFIVRSEDKIWDPEVIVEPLDLEDVVLAYMGSAESNKKNPIVKEVL